MSLVYKICSKDEWKEAVKIGLFSGSAVDARDGFIHLSTKEQVKVTVLKHFSGQKHLLIIQFKVDKLKTKLKWEISRDNDLFPHYYGHIETHLAEKVFNLDLGPNGVHEFPKNFFS